MNIDKPNEPVSIRLFMSRSVSETTSELKVTAHGVNTDPAVFVYHVIPHSSRFGGAVFEAVASLSQMNNIPQDSVVWEGGDEMTAYYRTNHVNLVFPNEAAMLDSWNIIREDCASLVRDLNAALILDEGASVQITGPHGTEIPVSGSGFLNIPLSPLPAGEPAVDGGVQIILTADTEAKGWLPVAEAADVLGQNVVVPENAAFFYNPEGDVAFKEAFNPQPPFDRHFLLSNGSQLQYGGVFSITEKAVFWLQFDPGVFYPPVEGNAPWNNAAPHPEYTLIINNG